MAILPEEKDLGANTSKYFDAFGNATIPSAYKVNGMTIKNREGEEVNIAREAISINIVEEIYTPVIKCNVSIRDDKNLFEEYKFNGEEILLVELEVISALDQQGLAFVMEFFVTDYPGFGKKQENPDAQTYSITAISTFAYISHLTRVSRAVPNPQNGNNGDPLLEIKDVFVDNLLFIPEEIAIASKAVTALASIIDSVADKLSGFLSFFGGGNSGSSGGQSKVRELIGRVGDAIVSSTTGRLANYVMIDTSFPAINKFKGNITTRSPLAAIEFLRTKAFDENLAPFFVYNRIGPGLDSGRGNSGDTVLVQSLSSILSAEPYSPLSDSAAAYTYSPSFVSKEEPATKEFYDEQKKRILRVESNLQLNQLQQAGRGVYGNTVWIFDYIQRDYIGKQYDPYVDREGIIEEMRIENDRPFEGLKYGDPLDGIVDLGETARITKYIKTDLHLPPPQNPSDEAEGLFTAPELYAQTLNKTKYYYSRLEYAATHEIEVYGDFNLNPGIKIELMFRKSIPTAAEDEPEGEEDTAMSGMYLILVASHSFVGGKYQTRLKVVKLHEEE